MSSLRVVLAVSLIQIAVSACGGTGGDTVVSNPTSPPTHNGPTDAQRAQAAAQTAQNNAACTAVQPFYWEIGDKNSMLTGGSAGGTTYTSATSMLIASASKWIFGAYLVQKHSGQFTANDLAALRMQSAHTNLMYASCKFTLTVDGCFTASNPAGHNSDVDPNAIGKFFYNGGHFQWLADTDLQLGAKTNATLQAEVAAELGMDFVFTYDSPQLAAGVQTTGQDYGFFLRKILSNQLLMHDFLGADAVCTNPATCGQALYTPVPAAESWHYSIGHWVEDDPAVGDGAFSSPGAFGFYPWIDASKTYYGVLARKANVTVTGDDTVGVESVQCGRLIRKAWLAGAAQ